jgi:phosphoinositide-3-kinase, regulatory subunit 4
MIALDPEVRPTFDALLHNAQGTVFPESFYSFFHSYVSNVNELPSPSPFTLSQPQAAHSTASTVTSAPSVSTIRAAPSTIAGQADGVGISGDVLPSDSDQRIEKIWADYESVEPYLLAQGVDGEATVTRVKMEGVDGTGVFRPFQVSSLDTIAKCTDVTGWLGYLPS